MIVEKLGNLLADDAQVLVCTTNSVGAMGKGLALDFAQKWPPIVPVYKRDCESGALFAGAVKIYPLPEERDLFSPPGDRFWAAFCTKQHWYNPSRMQWVSAGLLSLRRQLEEGNFVSVALPPLGCGNGGLHWPSVRQKILETLQDSPIEARVYAP